MLGRLNHLTRYHLLSSFNHEASGRTGTLLALFFFFSLLALESLKSWDSGADKGPSGQHPIPSFYERRD